MTYNVCNKKMSECLNKLRVYDLNQLCRKFLLSQHGKKAVVIERILDFITDAEKEEQVYQFILSVKPTIFETLNGRRINNNTSSSGNASGNNPDSGKCIINGNKYLSVNNSYFFPNNSSSKSNNSNNNNSSSNKGNSNLFGNNNESESYANGEIPPGRRGNAQTARRGKGNLSRSGVKGKIYEEHNDFSSCACGGMVKNIISKNCVVKCVQCNKLQHVSCYIQNSCDNRNLDEYKILCVVCRLKDLDPFYPMKKVLWVKNMNCNSEKFTVNACDIKRWKNENKEVIIFCITIDKENLCNNISLIQEWPKTFLLKVNGNAVEKVVEPSWDHKRRDSPAKITHALKAGNNNIDVSITNYEIPKLYVLAFLLCNMETEQSIIENVILKSSLNFKDAKQRIIDILSIKHDDDEVMCMETNRKISLNCPFSFDRILIPCRGINCCHIQCFDLKSYIDVTKKTKAFNNRWKCPICSLFLRPKDLVIDTFITYILSQVPKDIKEVSLNKSGEIIIGSNNSEGKIVKQVDDIEATTESKEKIEVKSEYVADKSIEYEGVNDNLFNRSEVIILDSDPEDDNNYIAYESTKQQNNHSIIQGAQEVICISDSDDNDYSTSVVLDTEKRGKEKSASFLIDMKNYENGTNVSDFLMNNLKNVDKRNILPNSHLFFNDMVLDVLSDIGHVHASESFPPSGARRNSNAHSCSSAQDSNSSSCVVTNGISINGNNALCEKTRGVNSNGGFISGAPLLSYYNRAKILQKDVYFMNRGVNRSSMKPFNECINYADSLDKSNVQVQENVINGTVTVGTGNTENGDHAVASVMSHNVSSMIANIVEKNESSNCAEDNHSNKRNDNGLPDEGSGRGDLSNKQVLSPSELFIVNHGNFHVIENDNNPPVFNNEHEISINIKDKIITPDDNKNNLYLKLENIIPLLDRDQMVNEQMENMNHFEMQSMNHFEMQHMNYREVHCVNHRMTQRVNHREMQHVNHHAVESMNNYETVSELNSELRVILQKENSKNVSMKRQKKGKKRKSNSVEIIRTYDSLCSNFNFSMINYQNKHKRSKKRKNNNSSTSNMIGRRQIRNNTNNRYKNKILNNNEKCPNKIIKKNGNFKDGKYRKKRGKK
ncbi:E3 SUMO-protein ligase PIAS, putative [Plasmodium ovale]|uniref:E3 SUMO-protein ligase PIAS, putative n=2 Tax=Plasmodium ovale TaxID=36330 RepID=A0A1D3TIX1_PLAOA|nr:E3 SUMO-protein ligase PIAS, putative [Plasmodium ovale]